MTRGPRAGSRRRALRDQAESPFSVILEEFLDCVPFARGAALVDLEGETVDYAGEVDPFELRVAAATFQLMLAEMRTCKTLSPIQFALRVDRAGYVVRALDESYSLLVVLRGLGTFCVSQRLLVEIESRILIEACLPVVRRPTFFRVEVETQGRRAKERPARIRPVSAPSAGHGSEWVTLEVLGALVGVIAGERAFRVLLPTGAEVTLTRDMQRLWFTDEPLEALMRRGSAAQPFQPGAQPSDEHAAVTKRFSNER